MILKSSLQLDWINSKTKEFKADPLIVEKVIRALVLLEELHKAGLNFIFKGGTSLMLMIQEPRRFSIDIDILIEDKTQNIEIFLDRVIKNSDFTEWKENKRKSDSIIDKKHYKIYYVPQTPMKGEINNILLDIVFESNPYTQTKETGVSHFLLQEERNIINVTTPTLTAILGDKLTAYGPNTTGVPLTKPMEVMKQIYDVAGIFDRIDNLNGVKENFIKVAKSELIYRGFKAEDYQIIIDDIINTSYNFCCYGKINADEYKIMQSGVSKLNNFIYGDKFREPQAQIALAKACYIAKQIEKDDTSIEQFANDIDMTDWTIIQTELNKLNKLKKHNLEAFYYWYKALIKL